MSFFMQLMVVVFVGLSTWSLMASSSSARKKRTISFHNRRPVSDKTWLDATPGHDPGVVRKVLELIAASASIDSDKIYPEDSFDRDLRLKGVWLIDEDAADDAAFKVKEELGIKWNYEWSIVAEAVRGVSQEIEKENSITVPKLDNEEPTSEE